MANYVFFIIALRRPQLLLLAFLKYVTVYLVQFVPIQKVHILLMEKSYATPVFTSIDVHI